MNTLIRKLILGCITAAPALGLSTAAFAQTPKATPAPPALPAPKQKLPIAAPRFPMYTGGETYERSIVVDPNITLSLCVVQGTLRVNGWNRNEARIFVKDGSRVAFKVREKGPKDNRPVWVEAIGDSPTKAVKAFPGCLWGDQIEIDLPVGSAVEIKGQETKTSIDNIKRLAIRNVGGDISVRNISGRITAATFQGDILVEESEGDISLETTTGNIVAFEVGPGASGDAFKAKSNSGMITMHSLRHRQIEAGSISGSLMFTGEIRDAGSYVLNTSNGSIKLALPAKTACMVAATYSSGNFMSELPLKILTEDYKENMGRFKSITARLGTGGDALLKLTTNNGSIGIRKQ